MENQLIKILVNLATLDHRTQRLPVSGFHFLHYLHTIEKNMQH